MTAPHSKSYESPPHAGDGLRVVDVAVGYDKTPVISGVSFDVDPGEWLAVIGPNGAGKSTLLKALVGVMPFDGSIELDAGSGRAGSQRGKSGRGSRSGLTAQRIGYVPQQPIFPLGMTTAEYVLLGRTAHLGWFESESRRDRQRVSEVLEQLALASMAGRPVTELSGGEAQRATLARALVQEASILVLDEPTSALDLAHQISVLELVDQLRRNRGLAVITAIHDLTIASRFAERLLLISNGAVAALGSPDQVLTETILSHHYGTPVTVMDGPDGGQVIVPLRSPSPGALHRPPAAVSSPTSIN